MEGMNRWYVSRMSERHYGQKYVRRWNREDVAGEGGCVMPGHRFIAGVERQYCSLYLPVPLIDQARALGQRTGLTRNAVVAMALDDYLRRHGQPDAGSGDLTTNEESRAWLHPI
jgi:hypothetical protein